MKRIKMLLLSLVIISLTGQLTAEDKSVWSAGNFSGLKMRSIGPALMAGRIADIAIHPENDNIWYVAVGSGNVWKTDNAGVTWSTIFEDQGSYSTGAITIDPSNPEVIWLGTGENVGGRHVGYGDGIYRSDDGGGSWTNMGLKESERISRIIIHPADSDIVWVAAQGPLWSKGGERGVYKTTDGGKNWKQTLGDKEWVGATELVIDPRNPDRLYAATWQRHRTIAAYMGGGPGTALYGSDDGGETWKFHLRILMSSMRPLSLTGGKAPSTAPPIGAPRGKNGRTPSPAPQDLTTIRSCTPRLTSLTGSISWMSESKSLRMGAKRFAVSAKCTSIPTTMPSPFAKMIQITS